MNNVKIFLFTICLPSLSLAAFEPTDCGEEFFRNANTVYFNPASLPKYSSAIFNYVRPFGMIELQYHRISFNFRNIGAGLSVFGNAIYNECELLLAYKILVGMVDLGGDIRGRLVSVKSYGSRFSPALDIGVRTHFTENIMLESVLQGSSKRFVMGLQLTHTTNAHLMVYLYKELGYSVGLKIGELLRVSPQLSLMFGANTIHSSFTLGTIFNLKKFELGYIISVHPTLGSSHIVSLGYGF